MDNNELHKIKYLFEYKQGVVISEQSVPPPPSGDTIPPPPSGDTSAVTTTTTTVKPVNPNNLRDCSGFKSGGKLTKGSETKEFIIFNNEKGIAVCKKPKETTVNESEFDDDFSTPEFSVEPHVRKQPREKQIEKMFGKYEDQIPSDILRYMRKNPQLMMDRLCRIYGDKFLDYAERAYIKYMEKK
jgi:hypothetical protein